MNRRFLSFVILTVLVAAVPLSADHAGNYHWRRTTAQITPPVHNNVTSAWDPYLDGAVAAWNLSVVVESPYGAAYGPISSAKRCTSATGAIEVCNALYGTTGWLSIGGFTLSGGHIVKAYTKLNDTYLNAAPYNTAAWRRLIVCQELGQTYGLDLADGVVSNVNTGSCMDATNNPAGGVLNGFDYGPSNEFPNAHDYATLEAIYTHFDAVSMPFDAVRADATRPVSVEEYMNKAGQWGEPVAFDAAGRPTLFRARHGEHDSWTHVFWAPVDPFEDAGEARGPGQRDRR